MCVENVQIPERLCRTTWQVRYTEFFLLAPFIHQLPKEIIFFIVKLFEITVSRFLWRLLLICTPTGATPLW